MVEETPALTAAQQTLVASLLISASLHVFCLVLPLAPLPEKPGRSGLEVRLPPRASVLDDSNRMSPPQPQADSTAPEPRPSNPAPKDEGLPAPLPLPPRYYEAQELTRQASPESELESTVPLATDQPTGGRMSFRLFIDETGRPERIEVIRSTLPRSIEAGIVQRFFTARYRPGEIDGLPVKSILTLEADIDGQPMTPEPASPTPSSKMLSGSPQPPSSPTPVPSAAGR